jgi:hypothetical protein
LLETKKPRRIAQGLRTSMASNVFDLLDLLFDFQLLLFKPFDLEVIRAGPPQLIMDLPVEMAVLLSEFSKMAFDRHHCPPFEVLDSIMVTDR